MRFTVLRSKVVSRYICDKQRQPSLVIKLQGVPKVRSSTL